MQAFSNSKHHVQSIGPPYIGVVLVMNYWVVAHFPSPAHISRLTIVPHSSFSFLAPPPYSHKC